MPSRCGVEYKPLLPALSRLIESHPLTRGSTYCVGVEILNIYFWHIPKCLEFLANIFTYSTTQCLVAVSFPTSCHWRKIFYKKCGMRHELSYLCSKYASFPMGIKERRILKVFWVFPNPADHFFAKVISFSILKQHMLTEENFFNSDI